MIGEIGERPVEFSLTIDREAWASVLKAMSILMNLALTLEWGPLRGFVIGARYGVRSSAWASQRPSYLCLYWWLATLSLLLTSFFYFINKILLLSFHCYCICECH